MLYANDGEDVKLGFYLGVRLANAATVPEWRKGDEFSTYFKNSQ